MFWSLAGILKTLERTLARLERFVEAQDKKHKELSIKITDAIVRQDAVRAETDRALTVAQNLRTLLAK